MFQSPAADPSIVKHCGEQTGIHWPLSSPVLASFALTSTRSSWGHKKSGQPLFFIGFLEPAREATVVDAFSFPVLFDDCFLPGGVKWTSLFCRAIASYHLTLQHLQVANMPIHFAHLCPPRLPQGVKRKPHPTVSRLGGAVATKQLDDMQVGSKEQGQVAHCFQTAMNTHTHTVCKQHFEDGLFYSLSWQYWSRSVLSVFPIPQHICCIMTCHTLLRSSLESGLERSREPSRKSKTRHRWLTKVTGYQLVNQSILIQLYF